MVVDRLRWFLNVGKLAVSATPLERRLDPRRKVSLTAEVLPIACCAEMRIVNVSKAGFAGETAASLQASHPIIFSIEKDRFHQGAVRWTRGRKFGADLDGAFSILGYFHEMDMGLVPSHKPRPRRYPVELPGQIALGPRLYHATVRDVSQSGLRLELDVPLRIGQQVIIRIADRPLILASVRWQGHQMAGFETAQRMTTLRLAYAGEW